MTEAEAPVRRMSAEQRRDEVVRAAGTVFGRNGYAGTTTDQVARAAGISQPYVVRMFGSKETLFLEVLDRAEHALLAAFRTALEQHRSTGRPRDVLEADLGDAYTALIADDGIHLPLMHGFLEGEDPAVGPKARSGFLRVWGFLVEEAGLTRDEAARFLGFGMLINVVLGLRMSVDPDPEARRLVDAACGPAAADVRRRDA